MLSFCRKRVFSELLDKCTRDPNKFVPLVEQLWQAMDTGDFAYAIEQKVLRFNGKLFKGASAIPLEKEEIGELLAAAKADWREVEPAIFGTLLEQALDEKRASAARRALHAARLCRAACGGDGDRTAAAGMGAGAGDGGKQGRRRSRFRTDRQSAQGSRGSGRVRSFHESCVPLAFSIPLAAPATSFTSRWS